MHYNFPEKHHHSKTNPRIKYVTLTSWEVKQRAENWLHKHAYPWKYYPDLHAAGMTGFYQK